MGSERRGVDTFPICVFNSEADDISLSDLHGQFDFNALIDDINDKESESSVAAWLRQQNYQQHFVQIQKLITPQGYKPQRASDNALSSKYDVEREEKGDNTEIKITIKESEKKEEDDANDIVSSLKDIDPSNISELVGQLNSLLDLDNDPSLVQDLIHQLQVTSLSKKYLFLSSSIMLIVVFSESLFCIETICCFVHYLPLHDLE